MNKKVEKRKLFKYARIRKNMIKKGVVFCIILVLLLTSSVYFALAQETEEDKVDDAYDWLMNEVRGKWDNLNIKEHIFSLLALKCDTAYTNPGKASLNNKAFISSTEKCWGSGPSKPPSESSCELTESALGKIVFDNLNEDTNKTTTWLLNQKKFFKNINWFLQLDIDRGYTAICYVTYEDGNVTVNIKEDKTLEMTANNCFEYYQGGTGKNYWLSIKPDCYEKPLKIRCFVSDENQLFRTNFLYKKDLSANSEWHLSPKLFEESSGHVIEMHIESYCLADSTGICDYEGTAWAAYALSQTEYPELYSPFIPYLIIESDNNIKYFPYAFLDLIGISNYGVKVEADQTSAGFWMTTNTKYGQFYDTAVGGMTGQGNLGSEYGGARYYLTINNPGFKQQGTYRYWKCTEGGCKDLRDTAFLLWVYWPYLCPGLGGGVGGDCEDQGFDYRCNESCILGEEIIIPEFDCPNDLFCCKLTGGTSIECTDAGGSCKDECDSEIEYEIWEIICPDYDYCCKKYEDSSCDDIDGEVCGVGKTCSGTQVYTLDGDCCLGSCIAAGDYDYCSETDPVSVNCDNNQVCVNDNTWELIPFIETTYETSCCPYPGKCVEDVDCSSVGRECNEIIGEECVGTIQETKDVENCCYGECLKSCTRQGGTECTGDKTCSVNYIDASDSYKCCPSTGQCKKPRSLWWLWILVILIIIALVLVYFFKFRKKKKMKNKPNLFGITPISRRPITRMPLRKSLRPMPTRRPMPMPAGVRARPTRPVRPRPMPIPRPGLRMPIRKPAKLITRPKPTTTMPIKPRPLPRMPMATATALKMPKTKTKKARKRKTTTKIAKKKEKSESELERTLKKLKKMTKK